MKIKINTKLGIFSIKKGKNKFKGTIRRSVFTDIGDLPWLDNTEWSYVSNILSQASDLQNYEKN